MKRFYKEVNTSPLVGEVGARSATGEGFQILLDGRAVKTPLRAPLTLPTSALAQAIAEEWRGQGEELKPQDMLLTKLANTALDRVAARRDEVIGQILSFANDNLCYRAAAPAGLVAQQKAEWDPLLAWASKRYGVPFETRTGITYFAQSPETLAALRAAIAAYDDFVLAALHSAASLLSSLILTLALAEQRLTAEEAFALSQLEERYQAEKWGTDEEAAARAQNLLAELTLIERFLRLAKL